MTIITHFTGLVLLAYRTKASFPICRMAFLLYFVNDASQDVRVKVFEFSLLQMLFMSNNKFNDCKYNTHIVWLKIFKIFLKLVNLSVLSTSSFLTLGNVFAYHIKKETTCIKRVDDSSQSSPIFRQRFFIIYKEFKCI